MKEGGSLAHLFVSYSRTDGQTVERLLEALRTAGHTTWLDKRTIRAGDDWQLAIERGIADADVLLLVLSQSASSSEWVAKELRSASQRHIPILPILIGSMDASAYPEPIKARNLQIVSAIGDEFERGVRKLLSDLRPVVASAKRIPFLVDHPRLPHFVGRDDELQRLHRLLMSPTSIGARPVGLTGMGGVGKTQLAVEYAHRYRYFYPAGVFMIDASREWHDEFDRLASRMMGEQFTKASSILTYVSENPESLVVFDNLQEPSDLAHGEIVDGVRPVNLPCHVLFTSRKSHEPAGLAGIAVGMLPFDEAKLVLVRHRSELLEDSKGLNTVCQALGFLPLALDLGAAFLARKKTATLAAYLDHLESNGMDATHAEAQLRAGDLDAYYAASLVPALRAQWSLLATADAPSLIRILSLFSSGEQVPLRRLGLMLGLADSSDGIVTPLADAVRDAGQVNLVERLDGSACRLHPLVRDHVLWERVKDERGSLVREAGGEFERALRDPVRLVDEIVSRSGGAVTQDYVSIGALVAETDANDPGSGDRALSVRLEERAELLGLESPTLDVPAVTEAPKPPKAAHVLQQLHNRAIRLGVTEFAEAARIHALAERRPGLFLTDNDRFGPHRNVQLRHRFPAQYEAIALHRGCLVAATDGRVCAIPLSDKVAERRVDGPRGKVQRLILCRDPSCVVVWSESSLWSVDFDQELLIAQLDLSDWPKSSVVYATEANLVLLGDAEGVLRIWNPMDGDLQTLEGRCPASVLRLAITPDARRALVAWAADDDPWHRLKKLGVWDLATGECERELPGTIQVVTMAIDAVSGRALTGAYDEEQPLRVWDLNAGVEITRLPNMASVDYVEVVRPGIGLFAGNFVSDVTVLDLESGEPLRVIPCAGAPQDIVVDNSKSFIAVLAAGHLELWRLPHLVRVGELRGDRIERVFMGQNCLALADDGDVPLVATREEGGVRVWDLTRMPVEPAHRAAVTELDATADGRLVATGGGDTVSLWGPTVARPIDVLRHEGTVSTLWLSPNGRRVVSGAGDRLVRIWDAATGECQRLVGHSKPDPALARMKFDAMFEQMYPETVGGVSSLAVAPDQRIVASGSRDYTVRVWVSGSPEARHILRGHRDEVTGVAFVRGGRSLVSVGRDGRIIVWDPERGKVVSEADNERSEYGPTSFLSVVAISDNEVVTLSGDAVRVWNIDSLTAEVLPNPELGPGDHEYSWRRLAATRDRRFVAAGGGYAAVWRTSTRSLEQSWSSRLYDDRIRRMGGRVQDIAISDDGCWIALCWNHTPVLDVIDVHDPESVVARAYFDAKLSRIVFAQGRDVLYCGDEAGEVFRLDVVHDSTSGGGLSDPLSNRSSSRGSGL